MRDFEGAFFVSRPGNDRSARGPLATLAITKAGKLLRTLHLESNRMTEAVTRNGGHLVVLEELDTTGLDRILGADNLEVFRTDQMFED